MTSAPVPLLERLRGATRVFRAEVEAMVPILAPDDRNVPSVQWGQAIRHHVATALPSVAREARGFAQGGIHGAR